MNNYIWNDLQEKQIEYYKKRCCILIEEKYTLESRLEFCDVLIANLLNWVEYLIDEKDKKDKKEISI